MKNLKKLDDFFVDDIRQGGIKALSTWKLVFKLFDRYYRTSTFVISKKYSKFWQEIAIQWTNERNDRVITRNLTLIIEK